MIDFDEADNWAPKLDIVLAPYVPSSIAPQIQAAAPMYVEDARDLLLNLTARDEIIDAILKWIRSENVVAYHGSRLTDEELNSIKVFGLIPLAAETRSVRLIRTLSRHTKWQEIAPQLPPTLQAHGTGAVAGSREGQVHLTISRAGLRESFNHYLTHGSEFDKMVAFALLGAEGVDLLAGDGEPRVLRLSVPGDIALHACHPHFSIDDMRARGNIPNFVNELLEVWAYRLVHPDFQSDTLRTDCGLVFYSPVRPDWIISIETLNKAD